MKCDFCDTTSSFVHFDGLYGFCDFPKNSTFTGNVDNCAFYNNDKTCKEC